jgi:hypothetical protein
VSLGLTDQDWSSFYRLFNTPRIDYEALTGCILQQTLAHTSEREGLHESLALEMGASLSGEGGATGGMEPRKQWECPGRGFNGAGATRGRGASPASR